MPAAITATAAAAPKAPHAVSAASASAAAATAADAVFGVPDIAALLAEAIPTAAASTAPPSSATAATKTPAPKAADKTADTGKAAAGSAPGEGTLAWLLSALSGALAPAAVAGGDQLADGASAQAGTASNGHEQGAAARAGATALAQAAIPSSAAASPVPASPAVQADAANPQLPGASGAPAAATVAATAAVKPAAAPAIQAAAPANAAANNPASSPTQIIPTDAVAAGLTHGTDAGAAPVSQPPAAAHAALDLTQANWPTALAEHVHWQIQDGVQEARLELNPRELGSVQVHVRLSGNETQVQFTTVHPQMREVLSAGLPQLRALLADGGLQLSQAQVGGQGQSPRQAPAPWTGGNAGEASAQDDEVPALTRPGSVRIGLVDDFA